jgi:hypothetical protein
MKTLKVVIIEAQFPELKGGAYDQHGRGTGSSVKAAMSRAFSDLLGQPKLRHKRFSRFTAIVSVGQQAVGQDGSND